MRVVHRAHTAGERARLRAAADAAQCVRPPGIARVVSIDEHENENDDGDTVLVVVTDEPATRVPDGELTAASLDALVDALARLHRIGHAHGDVDRQHLRVDAAGRLVLPLPRWRGRDDATIEDDDTRLRTLRDVPQRGRRWRVPPRAPTCSTSRRRSVGVAAMVAGVVVIAAATVLPSNAGTPPATTAPGATPRTTDDVSRPTVPATTSRIVEVDGRRYVVGDPGDLVVVGAWGCADVLTPVVVRPRTGAVLAFDRWGDSVAATPVTVLDGVTAAGRTTDAGGCHQLVVTTATGPTAVDVRTTTATTSVRAAARPPRSPATDRAP